MSGTPKFLEFFQDRADKKHELDMARMQIDRELELKRAGLEIQERIEAIHTDQIEMQTTAQTSQAIIGAQQAEMQAIYAHDVEIGDNHIVWGYHYKNKLIAWSKIYQYNNALESVYFAWDSCNMELQLGINSLHHEIAWAKSLGYDFLYIGPGYEVCSKYKAQVEGFEFWDGENWNLDKKTFLELARLS